MMIPAVLKDQHLGELECQKGRESSLLQDITRPLRLLSSFFLARKDVINSLKMLVSCIHDPDVLGSKKIAYYSIGNI